MTDERDRHHEDEDLTPVTPSTLEEAEAEAAQGSTDFVETERAEEQLDEADAAEIDEAEAAAAEEWQEDLDQDEDAQFQIEEAMAAAHQASLEARATWSLVHRELFVFLFANILFFVGVLAAWSRMSAGLVSSAEDPTTWVANQINGLDTIRGTIIFALSLYGFWTIVFNIWYRQLKIWPFLINALLALWVGIPAFTSGIGSARWDAAKQHLDDMPTKTLLDKITVPMSSIAPGYWLLTIGGALVLIVLLKGILGGMSSSKGQPAEAGEGRRRRR